MGAKYSLFILSIVLIFASCIVEEQPNDGTNPDANTNIIASDDFDWKINHQVVISLDFPATLPEMEFRISSLDGNILYIKGKTSNHSYLNNITLPKHIEQIRLDVEGDLYAPKAINISNNIARYSLPSITNTNKSVSSMPWSYTNTGINQTILFTTNVSINNFSLEVGDYIGLFYLDGGVMLCGGYKAWQGSNTAMSAWGDDNYSSIKDGFAENEQMNFRIWKAATGEIYNLIATFSNLLPGDGTYNTNSSSNLESLSLDPNSPLPISPPIPWSYTMTNNTHSFLLSQTTTTNGFTLESGDYLGAFFENSGAQVCGGYAEWQGSNITINAWRNNTSTSIKDGFDMGELINWKIWKASTGFVIDLTASYNGGSAQGYFQLNGMSSIASLTNNLLLDSDADGVSDVLDDFPLDPHRAYLTNFPADGFGTYAFEDLWPETGDYDFNDMVVDYRFATIEKANNDVVEILLTVVLKAHGANYENGLGVRFNNILPNWVNSVSGYNLQEGFINHSNGLELGQNKATVIIFDNAFNIMPKLNSNAIGVNTSTATHPPVEMTIELALDTNLHKKTTDIYMNGMPELFMIVNKIRGHEIHLPNNQPTELADLSLFGTFDDDSNGNKTYLSVDNFPWAIEVGSGFNHTFEKDSIALGHLKFVPWVNSSGNLYNDWYKNLPNYRNNNHIYY